MTYVNFFLYFFTYDFPKHLSPAYCKYLLLLAFPFRLAGVQGDLKVAGEQGGSLPPGA